MGHRGRIRTVDPCDGGAATRGLPTGRAATTARTVCCPGSPKGWKFVWRNKVLRTLGLIDLAVTGLYLPMESVLFPKYFTDRNEPAELGWVLMALSIGGLIGALSWTVLSG